MRAEALVSPWGRPNGRVVGLGAPVVRGTFNQIPACGVGQGTPAAGGRGEGGGGNACLPPLLVQGRESNAMQCNEERNENKDKSPLLHGCSFVSFVSFSLFRHPLSYKFHHRGYIKHNNPIKENIRSLYMHIHMQRSSWLIESAMYVLSGVDPFHLLHPCCSCNQVKSSPRQAESSQIILA